MAAWITPTGATWTVRGVFWVTRAKDNVVCRVKWGPSKSADPRVPRDELVVCKGEKAERR